LLKELGNVFIGVILITAVMRVVRKPLQDYWPEGEPALVHVGTKKRED